MGLTIMDRANAVPKWKIGLVCIVTLFFSHRLWGLGVWMMSPTPGLHEMEPCSIGRNITNGVDTPWIGQEGIVVTVSGKKKADMDMTLANLKIIRHTFKNNIPVELWYHGHEEAYPPFFRKMVCELGNIQIRDIARRGSCWKYYCKLAAVDFSQFGRVLLLDSNTLLFQNPSVFFQLLDSASNQYSAAAVYLFRDYVPCFSSMSRIWVEYHLGIKPADYCKATYFQEIDSSAVVIDMSRGGKASVADAHDIGGYFLKGSWLLGDKDMWLLAAMRKKVSAVVHSQGPAFFTYEGVPREDGGRTPTFPFEGHLHVDAMGSPLYANMQMVSVCHMADNRLKYYPNEDPDARVLPYCEAWLTDDAKEKTKPIDSAVRGIMKTACEAMESYHAGLGDKNFQGDLARSCPWKQCGVDRPVPSTFTCVA